MSEESGLRERLAKQGEETLGKVVQDLLENPMVSGALGRAFDAREKAAAAQEVAMGALNLPSAADVERLTRRLRSVSQRLEGIEDSLDRLDRRLESTAQAASASGGGGQEDRLGSVEDQLRTLVGEVRRLARGLDAAPTPVPREQERLAVDGEKPTKPAKPAARRPAAKKKTS